MRVKTDAPIPEMIDIFLGEQEIDITAHSRVRKRQPDHEKGKKASASSPTIRNGDILMLPRHF
jgi:hypothetical protein